LESPGDLPHPRQGPGHGSVLSLYANAHRGKVRKAAVSPLTLRMSEEEFKPVPSKGWAAMIRKVYELDPMVCPKCGGQMKVVAFITDYVAVDRIIDHLKLRFIAEKRLLQILIESEELRPYIFAEVRDEDFKGLKSEPIFRIILDHFKKDNDLIFHELQKEIGPSLSWQLSQALLEKGNPPTAEEALDCLCALQKSCKENELKRIQAELAREEKKGDRDKVQALLFQKQDLIKQSLALK
jgi:hypothetical protein